MLVTSENIINRLINSRQKLAINSEMIIRELSDDFESEPYVTNVKYNSDTTVLIWQRKGDFVVDRNNEFRICGLFSDRFYDISNEQLQNVLSLAIENFNYLPEFR